MPLYNYIMKPILKNEWSWTKKMKSIKTDWIKIDAMKDEEIDCINSTKVIKELFNIVWPKLQWMHNFNVNG